jgi:hypothetical protein
LLHLIRDLAAAEPRAESSTIGVPLPPQPASSEDRSTARRFWHIDDPHAEAVRHSAARCALFGAHGAPHNLVASVLVSGAGFLLARAAYHLGTLHYRKAKTARSALEGRNTGMTGILLAISLTLCPGYA